MDAITIFLSKKSSVLNKKTIYVPAAWAGIFVVVCALLPLMIGLNASFLGRDVSTIAAGVVAFYPVVAVLEVIKILSLSYLLFFIFFVAAYHSSLKARSPGVKFFIFPSSIILAYGLFSAALILKYPALFDPYLSPGVEKYVYMGADWITPTQLQIFALFLVSASILPNFPIAVVPLGLVLFFVFKPDFLSRQSTVSNLQKPNIIFIAIDSLRSDRAANQKIMPNFNKILHDERSVKFDDHFVGIPRTFPSWVELLEGRNAPRTRIRHMFPGFYERHNERENLVKALEKVGYETTVISDFAGDIFPRVNFGFNKVIAPNLKLETLIKMSVDLGMPLFLPIMTASAFRETFASIKESPNYADPSHLVDLALDQFKIHAGVTPFFLTLFFSTAHFPYGAPFPYYKLYTVNNYEGQYYFQKNPGVAHESISELDIEQIRGLYDGSLRAIDDQIARIINYLKSSGQWDNTLIVVSADHGEDIYEEGVLQGHGEHLRGKNVLQVPFLIKLPAPFLPPKSIPFLSRSIDIAPTLASIVGASDWGADGFDWSPWLKQEKADSPELNAYAETGIWFSRDGAGFYQGNRIDYPGISAMLSFDQGYSGEIVLNHIYEEVILTAKHRALITPTHKIIYVPGRSGVHFEFYKRDDDQERLLDPIKDDVLVFESLKKELLNMILELEKPDRHLLDNYVVRRQ